MAPLRSKLIRLAYSMPSGEEKRALVGLLRQARGGPDFVDFRGYRTDSDDPTDINWQEGLWWSVLSKTRMGEGRRVYYRKWGHRKLTALLDGLQDQIMSAKTYDAAKKAIDRAATEAYRLAARGGARNTKGWGSSTVLELVEQVADGLEKLLKVFPKYVKKWGDIIKGNHLRAKWWAEEQRMKVEDPDAYLRKQEAEAEAARAIYEALRDDAREIGRKQESYSERKWRERMENAPGGYKLKRERERRERGY